MACCMAFAITKARAQAVCTGTLGDPVVNIDFGRGNSNFGPALPAGTTSYPYTAASPNDGFYTIVKSTANLNSGWHAVNNRTPNDPNGYLMLINANQTPGNFYEQRVSGLCSGTTYEFAAWVINLLNYAALKPNITFTILSTGGTSLATYTTGDIAEGSNTSWKQYGMLFQTPPGATEVILRMTNNGPGGVGNDMAIDDITFRACGPSITTSINNAAVSTANLCAGANGTFNLSAVLSGGYSTPQFQWQLNTGSGWNDIPGAATEQTTVNFTNAQTGIYQYRMLAAEQANFSSVNCRVASAVLTINVEGLPVAAPSNNGPVCVGGTARLNVNVPQGGTVSWTGPNGFSSSLAAPELTNVSPAMAGAYTVVVTGASGCNSLPAQTTLQVNPVPVAAVQQTSVSICEGSQVQLQASGGSTYSWAPATGLSDVNIANPVANPTQTTTYTVIVSNGPCQSTATVLVTVLKNPEANAGEDRRLFVGQSVRLQGEAAGDNVTYSWLPTTYLDDPTSLTPTATPPSDITYTLYVQSASGCVTATDEVTIRVYDKIVIMNTFSPNGDGQNDTWNIGPFDGFPNCTVKVMNRMGELVYSSLGYPNPWNGQHNGRDLPVGTYFYVIDVEPGMRYSGWVFIAR